MRPPALPRSLGATLLVGAVLLRTPATGRLHTAAGAPTPSPALLVLSLVVLAAFVAWEVYRERRDKSVIMPMSLWTKPGTKMAPMVAVVFLAWCVPPPSPSQRLAPAARIHARTDASAGRATTS